MIKVIGLALAAALLSVPTFGAQITYVSCDLPATEASLASHFDFTLDEQRGTVSYFVKDAEATNVEKAVFGPDAVTWTIELPLGKITRKISRIDLSFVEDLDLETIGMPVNHRVGKCSLVDPSSRKF
jgi:hypothetical protein